MTEKQAITLVNSQINMLAEMAKDWHYAGLGANSYVGNIIDKYVYSIIKTNSCLDEYDLNGLLLSNLESQLETLKLINYYRPQREEYDHIDRIEQFYEQARDTIINSDYYKNEGRKK